MFREYDVVCLKTDIIALGLNKGTIGAVMMVYASNPQDYEVEFVDRDGNSLGVFTMPEERLDSADSRR